MLSASAARRRSEARAALAACCSRRSSRTFCSVASILSMFSASAIRVSSMSSSSLISSASKSSSMSTPRYPTSPLPSSAGNCSIIAALVSPDIWLANFEGVSGPSSSPMAPKSNSSASPERPGASSISCWRRSSRRRCCSSSSIVGTSLKSETGIAASSSCRFTSSSSRISLSSASVKVFFACSPSCCHSPRNLPASADSRYSSLGPSSAQAHAPMTIISGVPRLRKLPPPPGNI
mmetsp:Transcript_64574/g.155778  ORF Transcript_64574/g.155778 Transcript_64574/m.155778 type:complete len:235 (+) Transcript_64574:237-941(+)